MKAEIGKAESRNPLFGRSARAGSAGATYRTAAMTLPVTDLLARPARGGWITL